VRRGKAIKEGERGKGSEGVRGRAGKGRGREEKGERGGNLGGVE